VDWDVCMSLLDNHVSPSFEANLEYMFKKFGFYFPDSQYLTDPEGLMKYLVGGAESLWPGGSVFVCGGNWCERKCVCVQQLYTVGS
jgi:hypothetical protein